jgi:hypothetical protein
MPLNTGTRLSGHRLVFYNLKLVPLIANVSETTQMLYSNNPITRSSWKISTVWFALIAIRVQYYLD